MDRRRARRRIGVTFLVLAAGYALLHIPDTAPPEPEGAGMTPFVWDRDELWADLARRFEDARERGCAAVAPEIDADRSALDEALQQASDAELAPDAAPLADVEHRLFELAPLYGACLERVPELVGLSSRVRDMAKDQSRRWDLSDPGARDSLYRLLYGSRAAAEELLLQMPPDQAPALVAGIDEPSETPSAEVHGVRIHSGDLLVSRGGAPTSAFIARGNDHPGNFSHVALVYVDADTHTPRVIESHIEVGVVASSAEEYLSDKKLRILVLRMRSDLPAMRRDPMLPHRAAEHALAEVRSRHIPYDFEMDFHDPTAQFCSEVASAAYHSQHVELWQDLSSISARGTAAWLAAFGVRNFVTQAPSDLEHDPQLRVVAEWRDPETLYQDHVDNAVIDALLEAAERGDRPGYSWSRLPLARLAKAYSVVMNLFGEAGPVPEGMSATVALRVERLRERHAAIKRGLMAAAARYERERGHRPPYWDLVRMARNAMPGEP